MIPGSRENKRGLCLSAMGRVPLWLQNKKIKSNKRNKGFDALPCSLTGCISEKPILIYAPIPKGAIYEHLAIIQLVEEGDD